MISSQISYSKGDVKKVAFRREIYEHFRAHAWTVICEAVSWFLCQSWLWLWFILGVALLLLVGICVWGLTITLVERWRARRSSERAANIMHGWRTEERQTLLRSILTFDIRTMLARREEQRREQERKVQEERAEAQRQAQEELRAMRHREEAAAQRVKMAYEAEHSRSSSKCSNGTRRCTAG